MTYGLGLGLKMHEAAHKNLKDYDNRITDIYTWIDEYFIDAKKTFDTYVLL